MKITKRTKFYPYQYSFLGLPDVKNAGQMELHRMYKSQQYAK